VFFAIIHYILAFFVNCPKYGKWLTIPVFNKIKLDTHDSGLEIALL
jgi:hypothetical protein